jgi:hypothetical protein
MNMPLGVQQLTKQAYLRQGVQEYNRDGYRNPPGLCEKVKLTGLARKNF